MVIQILSGMLLGVLCTYLCRNLASFLLQKRGKEYTKFRFEFLITGAVMVSFCTAICLLIPLSAERVFFILLLIAVGTASVTDIHARIIPNDTVLAVMILTLLFGIPTLFGVKGFYSFNLLHSILGFVTGFLIFSLPGIISGKIGAGDVKLAAACGFCLGIWANLFCIVIMGIIVLSFTLLQKKLPVLGFMKSMIPMGPFISASMMIVLIVLYLPAFEGYTQAFPF